ncbi:TATA box-binding protein-associated factor, RNA polymerase I, subunit C isoform X2 [Echeneis naucrates]|uniref:TATA box-binding protein-associated factor, RNA polymerase I, subunit C isoform X2 n=1 Tax=Echeneis naucrates TaxID=173247 RepID=UPI0011141FF2|nr:TATA box-binding protein-associated factor RNA polymerase I subunit C isoform X2 [Echeneis naucrates]
MDYEFPQQLFPTFYNCGPPDSVPTGYGGGSWGSYGRVRPQGGSGPLSSWTFTPSHDVSGEKWRPTEPVPLPLLSPKNSYLWPSKPPDPKDFTEHMHNFFVDHYQDAFGCMSDILGKNFDFKEGRKEVHRKDSIKMFKVNQFLNMLNLKICHRAYSSKTLEMYSVLMSDVVHSVPPELLGSLLHEELTEQRNRLLFSEAATGGALNFIPFSQSGSGCLIYSGNKGLDCLNFHKVELQTHRGSSFTLDTSSSVPFSFQLKGPVRQISATSIFSNSCVAVRSDYLCGVWRVSERNEPRLLEVVNTREVSTCVNVSPHILGEVLVASESGAVNLWTVGRRLQVVRKESSNLYFNAKSLWRWCEFSAHPRVILYADRTGVELTDMRTNPCTAHTLFRISNTPECRRGERLILSRYLGDAHSFHHLITTQYSAYIMDERFPCVPMLKWDHAMQSPPLFCHVLSGSTSSSIEMDAVGSSRSTKVLLGSHSSQEITLLQYSGGKTEACFSRGPAQALFRPIDSLKQLPVQIPHRLDAANNRLSSPAAGLVCFERRSDGEECICILQLTEAGDIFYQILKLEHPDGGTSRPPAAEDEPAPPGAAKNPLKEATTLGRKVEQLVPDSQLDIADMLSDEGVIGPTQAPAALTFVAETPEKNQPEENTDSDVSDLGGRAKKLKQLCLQVIANDDPEENHVSGWDGVEKAEKVGRNKAELLQSKSQVQLSEAALLTWRRWLQKLMQKTNETKLRGCRLWHLTTRTQDILHLPNVEDEAEKECVQSLRKDMRTCMSKHSVLLHSNDSSLQGPDVVPVPNCVDTDMWRDQLSHRLTLSWQGEEVWRAWWEDKLGLNKEDKLRALRRKRKREKEAKRASGRRLELSGSFTSSVSYQSDLDSFSDSVGWSSATSQGVWSDEDITGPLSQLEGFLKVGSPRALTPSTLQADSQIPKPIATPQKNKEGGQQTHSSSQFLSQTVKPFSAAVSQRRTKKSDEHHLRSLFASQDEPWQHTISSLEESDAPPPTPSSSQRYSFQSAPQQSQRMDLSQDCSIWSGLSQSVPLSQGSQGRLGLSQVSHGSQLKRKKSRMGF